MGISWHQNFNPQQFLSRVDVEKLITRNKAYPENEVASLISPCILCSQQFGSGIVLNDRSFICKSCFHAVSLIEYPERYETLRREYLKNREARRVARSELIDHSVTRKVGNFFVTAAAMSVLLIFWKPLLFFVPILGFGIAMFVGQIHNGNMKQWEKEFPEPTQPQTKHFHDPSAVLTPRDQLVLDVFNHWPGYPPFWKYLREVVLTRDGHRCQVTGCPSRLEKHIHHRTPVSKGGAHAPENLISLCDFHHALEPDAGHERIWADIKTRYFTLVRPHSRSNRTNSGTHKVSQHLRRLELVSAAELIDLANTYGLSCPHCNSDQIQIRVFERRNIVEIECLNCMRIIEGPQELAEETGPRLAELLIPTLCRGTWTARWDMLSERRETEWTDWRGPNVATRRTEYHRRRAVDVSRPNCPKCGSPMHVVSPKRGEDWKPFWGCTQYRVTHCKGSVKLNI